MTVRISVINFKGGVGKSTLAFHLAAYLAQTARVLIVDVDHQSSLSIVVMGADKWEAAATNRHTCNTIFESFCNRKVSMPGAEIISSNPLLARHPWLTSYKKLDIVPAQFELDDTEIEMASTTMGSAMLSEWHKRTLLAEWLDHVNVNDNYHYVIFDCPPATKLVSQNALAASQFYVIPVIPDVMSSRGVTHFRTLVNEKIDKKLEFLRTGSGVAPRDVPKSYSPTTTLAGIAPFMAKPAGNAASGLVNIHTEQLAALRRRWGKDIVPTTVKHLAGVAEAMDAGLPVWDAYQSQNIRKVVPMMRSVCKEISERVTP